MVSAKLNLTVVGVFVLACVSTLIVALAILAGSTGSTDRYYTEFNNVTGLKYGSQVLYEGFPIGQVESIDPFQEQGRMGFRVELSVVEGWNIPDDSVARSEAGGLLAPQTVTIAAGRSATVLEPGAKISAGITSGLLESMSSLAGSVDQFTEQSLLPLVDNLNRQVNVLGVILEKDVRPFLGSANKVMGSAAQRLPSILERVDQAAGDLSAVSQKLDRALSEESVASLNHLLVNADAASVALKKSSEDLSALIVSAGPNLKSGADDFRYTMEALSRHAEPFAQNLDASSRNFAEFSRMLRQNPGLLLRNSERPDDPVPPLRERTP